MHGYDFIDQSSMRAAPGEVERPGGGRCGAHWWPWGGRRGEDLFALRLLYSPGLVRRSTQGIFNDRHQLEGF